jgi:hypothetical protein
MVMGSYVRLWVSNREIGLNVVNHAPPDEKNAKLEVGEISSSRSGAKLTYQQLQVSVPGCIMCG